jgi:hypothetical protein
VPTQHLEHDGTGYELLCFYALPDDAWSIELTQVDGDVAGLAHVLVPDEDLERPCEVLTLEAEKIPPKIFRELLLAVAEISRHAGVTFARDQHAPPEA